MAVLFGLAVLVQFNDPDPLRWMLMYGAACGVAVRAAFRGTAPLAVSLAVGVVAFSWAAVVMRDGPALDVYTRMFGSWEMKSLPIEEAREASGLLIVGIWTAVVASRSWRD
jgi:hypothetical protein